MVKPFKKLIFGGPFGWGSREWCPQIMSKYLSVKYLLINKLAPKVKSFKKLILGVSGEDGTPKLLGAPKNVTTLICFDWHIFYTANLKTQDIFSQIGWIVCESQRNFF